MSERQYYSARSGINIGQNFPIETLREVLFSTFIFFDGKEYFQEALGKFCTTDDFIPGSCGSDIRGYFFRKLRKNIWPISDFYLEYSEYDIFDVIELLYDLISEPTEGSIHDWNQCGWHYSKFDKDKGQVEFRKAVNEFLRDYKDGYELSEDGQVLFLGDKGLTSLLEAGVPSSISNNVNMKVELAVKKFRSSRSSFDERKKALRDLADALEYLRPQIKEHMLTKDEADLFNIANNFSIRHHNDHQKSDYDANWLSWIFYIYLSTIHLMIRVINKSK